MVVAIRIAFWVRELSKVLFTKLPSVSAEAIGVRTAQAVSYAWPKKARVKSTIAE
jgi:hypothetical protein